MEKAFNIIVNGDNGPQFLKEYLRDLLLALWTEKEGFSGKRPFGNSGWNYDVYAALIKADLIEGTLDEEGFVEDLDEEAADEYIIKLVYGLFSK